MCAYVSACVTVCARQQHAVEYMNVHGLSDWCQMPECVYVSAVCV